MLPNFVVIGAMKAGTTSLYRYLRAHPQAFMPEAKGLNIVADRHWGRGLGRYEAQFAGAGGPVAVGEAWPIHAMYPAFAGVADSIAEVLPQVRLGLRRPPPDRAHALPLPSPGRAETRARPDRALPDHLRATWQPAATPCRIEPRLLPPTLDCEFYRTAEKRKRRLLAEAVLRVPGSRALRRASRRPSPPPPSRARRLGYQLGDG
jgi:hypothetical protein